MLNNKYCKCKRNAPGAPGSDNRRPGPSRHARKSDSFLSLSRNSVSRTDSIHNATALASAPAASRISSTAAKLFPVRALVTVSSKDFNCSNNLPASAPAPFCARSRPDTKPPLTNTPINGRRQPFKDRKN